MYRVAVDETKRPNYALIAARWRAERTPEILARLVAVRPPHRSDIHMHRDARFRAAIARAVADLSEVGVSATIFNAGRKGPNELVRRAACIEALHRDAVRRRGGHHITLDRDESLIQRDRRLFVDLNRGLPPDQRVEYRHRSTKEDLLIAIPDVVGWCWSRRGDWWQMVSAIVDTVVDL